MALARMVVFNVMFLCVCCYGRGDHGVAAYVMMAFLCGVHRQALQSIRHCLDMVE
jgi:hypothetical protein